jgi:hypothetical protein
VYVTLGFTDDNGLDRETLQLWIEQVASVHDRADCLRRELVQKLAERPRVVLGFAIVVLRPNVQRVHRKKGWSSYLAGKLKSLDYFLTSG